MSRRRMRALRRVSGSSDGMKIARLLGMLVVLGLMYQQARKPETWKWLAPDKDEGQMLAEAPPKDEPQKRAGKKPVEDWQETIIEGPPGTDGDEIAEASNLFQALTDKAPLAKSEMPAYWRLLKWAMAEPMKTLEARASRDALFVQMFEEPDKYRGELIRLRLHIKRILKYDAPENSAGIKEVYEIWGWTDDSRSYPWVLITSELPPGFRLGADVPDEGVFVGYFLKWMSYSAFDKTRYAPLMLGRLRRDGSSRPAGRGVKLADSDRWFLWGLGGVVVFGAVGWVLLNRWKGADARFAEEDKSDDEDLGAFLSGNSTNRPPEDADANG